MGLRKRFKDFRDWCPQPPNRLPTKLKRYSIPIVAVLTAALIFSASFSIYSSNIFSRVPLMPLFTSTSSTQNFATGIAAADGKVFTIDNWGIVTCFNAETGAEVWSTKAGGFTATPQSMEIYNRSVYAATRGGVVVSLDENTGKVLLQFQGPVSSSFGDKTPPSDFSAGDDYVYVSSNGLAAYNANSAKLLWKFPWYIYTNFSTPIASMVWPFKDNVLIAQSGVE